MAFYVKRDPSAMSGTDIRLAKAEAYAVSYAFDSIPNKGKAAECGCSGFTAKLYSKKETPESVSFYIFGFI